LVPNPTRMIRAASEQVGDDAMKASMYGIKNLQRILPSLEQWTKEPNEDYTSVYKMYIQLTAQFSRYMGHVTKYVGGIMETPKTVEEQGPVYEIVPEAKQKEAVEFLNKQLFATPTWIINQDIYSKTAGLSGLTVVGNIQDNILGRLLSGRTFLKMLEAESVLGSNAYQVTELLGDLKKGIWSELAARKPIDIYRRNLQKSYINILTGIINPQASTGGGGGITFTITPVNDKSDVRSVVRAHLVALRAEANAAAAGIADPMSKFHLQDVVKRIDNALNPNQ
jgi:Met-zincin